MTVVIGAVGQDACIFVPQSNEVIIGIIPAASIPAKIHLQDCKPNAAPNESAAKETVNQAKNSVRNLCRLAGI